MNLTATIDSLAFGGNGVCRLDGKVCFVPFSCPGDQLRLAVTAEKRSYQTARITEILAPSADRVNPPCPVFGSCGGCNWQHIDYHRQLEAKRRILAETLWRSARVPAECVAETVPSPLRYGYRSRVQFKLYATPDRLHIGFYRGTTHLVEDIADGCAVALPVINQALQQLRPVLEASPGRTTIPQINVECGDAGCVAIVNYIGPDREGIAAYFREQRDRLASLTGLWLQTGRKSTLTRVWGDERLYYRLPSPGRDDILLGFTPGGFSQVNRDQNRTMLEIVREMAELDGTGHLLDLYCGNGNFSLPLAGSAASVTGMEEYEGSICEAETNMRANGIVNAEFLCADAAVGVRKLADAGRVFDLVILDPPRSGAPGVASEIPRLRPERIIYVSCDPNTMARDCGVLAGQGYRVERSIPLDMFPQTYHLESITLLRRENATPNSTP